MSSGVTGAFPKGSAFLLAFLGIDDVTSAAFSSPVLLFGVLILGTFLCLLDEDPDPNAEGGVK
jgi:hypothetical protein